MSSFGTLRPFSICLLVQDLDRTAAWYVTHLDLRETYRQHDLVFLSMQEFSVELVSYPGITAGLRAPDPPARGASTGISHFCLETVNLSKSEEVLRKQGIEILFPLESKEAGIKFFFIRDLEGNLIQLLQKIESN